MNTKQAEKQHIVEFQQEENFKLVIKMNEVISMLSKSEIYTGFVNLYKKTVKKKGLCWAKQKPRFDSGPTNY